MRTVTTTLAVSALTLCAAVSMAQVKRNAENGLVGIKLYDQGVRVVQMYGTPDDIQPVSFGGGNIGPGGGAGRGPGAPGGGGGNNPAMGGKGGFTPGVGGGWTGEYSFENQTLMRQLSTAGEMQPPPAEGGGGGAAPAPGAGRGGATGGSSQRVVFTRWIYKRGGSRYGFIIDRGNRVVQIEAIGLFNRKVRTKKGVGFGATFADLIKRYGTPDGYEIAGEQIVVRFLSRNNVAFRLSRLGENKPHVVTGVVVAAGRA